MTTLKNDRFLRALLREPVDTTPVWMKEGGLEGEEEEMGRS